jgi:hypothetical protein
MPHWLPGVVLEQIMMLIQFLQQSVSSVCPEQLGMLCTITAQLNFLHLHIPPLCL